MIHSVVYILMFLVMSRLLSFAELLAAVSEIDSAEIPPVMVSIAQCCGRLPVMHFALLFIPIDFDFVMFVTHSFV